MELLEKWVTPIARFNLADQFDMEAWALEVFTLNAMTNGEDASQEKVLLETFPIMLEMRDRIITPAVNEFSKAHFDYDMGDEFYVETNAKWIPPGEGLYPHLHPGSVISAICYPGDSENAINFFDPRCNAARGYPKPMRQHHFKAFRVSPRKGDIYIFPSYLNHSVSHVTEEIRLSLLHEYYVTKFL